jgi:hypothetical protein
VRRNEHGAAAKEKKKIKAANARLGAFSAMIGH